MMKIKKIEGDKLNLKVKGQGCSDDCVEKNVYVNRTDGNTPGCVIYETVHSPKTLIRF